MARINALLGADEEAKYVTGVYFAPSTSVRKFNHALRLFSADAAHLSWGSCTLYSLYGRNSNMGAFCIAHAIIAGNEDKQSWTSFFQFVLEHYPQINHVNTTIVSDRDKGLIGSILSVLPSVTGFYCSRHRAGNIAGRFNRAAVVAFNLAVQAKTLEALEEIKTHRIGALPSRAKSYIEAVADELQFPIARIV